MRCPHECNVSRPLVPLTVLPHLQTQPGKRLPHLTGSQPQNFSQKLASPAQGQSPLQAPRQSHGVYWAHFCTTEGAQIRRGVALQLPGQQSCGHPRAVKRAGSSCTRHPPHLWSVWCARKRRPACETLSGPWPAAGGRWRRERRPPVADGEASVCTCCRRAGTRRGSLTILRPFSRRG